jgi:hypothetical protein
MENLTFPIDLFAGLRVPKAYLVFKGHSVTKLIQNPLVVTLLPIQPITSYLKIKPWAGLTVLQHRALIGIIFEAERSSKGQNTRHPFHVTCSSTAFYYIPKNGRTKSSVAIY